MRRKGTLKQPPPEGHHKNFADKPLIGNSHSDGYMKIKPSTLYFVLPFCLLLHTGISLPAQQNPSVFVHFDFNRYILTNTARASLDSLTDSLDVADKIELHGHCDAVGPDEYNDRLSLKRVHAVKDYLLSIGWDKKDIIISQGHGERIPVVENSTPEKRSLNRRVEIRIIAGATANPDKEI